MAFNRLVKAPYNYLKNFGIIDIFKKLKSEWWLVFFFVFFFNKKKYKKKVPQTLKKKNTNK